MTDTSAEGCKKDHLALAHEMDLFHLQEDFPGSIFWHPQGWAIYLAMQAYIRTIWRENGYQEVSTPKIGPARFWDQSGHTEMFDDYMFKFTAENHACSLATMNCPALLEIAKRGELKDEKKLPLALAEFSMVFRNEPEASLHGLMRTRVINQDGVHFLCTKDQVVDEVKKFMRSLLKVYKDFGIKNIEVHLAGRPAKYLGHDDDWQAAEEALKKAAEAQGVRFTDNPNEGAFYGPKLDFTYTDVHGNKWELGTLQVDYVLPERMGVKYTGKDGKEHTPVFLHQGVFGSIERFMGAMLESTQGKIPACLEVE